MSTNIYYFSGTGNSLKIAKDLNNNLQDSKIIRICEANKELTSDIFSEKIGFIFPVYYRGLPHMVESFIKNLEVNPKTYFFAIANFGSYAALTFQQIDKLLMYKGTTLSANFSIAMPGNMWFMYYPHSKEDFTNRINDQNAKTVNIAKNIRNNIKTEIVFVKDSVSEEKMYLDFNPNDTVENFWTDCKCTGCGICSKVCPAKNIEIINNKPLWKNHCEQCLACLHWCPTEAIQYKNDSLNKKRYHNPFINVQELF